MAKIYKVGVVFTFEPEGEHEDLFEDMNTEEMVSYMNDMVVDDLFRYVASGEIARMISVEEIEVKD